MARKCTSWGEGLLVPHQRGSAGAPVQHQRGWGQDPYMHVCRMMHNEGHFDPPPHPPLGHTRLIFEDPAALPKGTPSHRQQVVTSL